MAGNRYRRAVFVCYVVCTERIHFLKTLNNVDIPGLSYFFAMSSAHSRIVFLKTPVTSISLEFDTAGLWYSICLQFSHCRIYFLKTH